MRLTQAIAAHESPAYQAALAVLGNTAVVRDMRIIEGVDSKQKVALGRRASRRALNSWWRPPDLRRVAAPMSKSAAFSQ